MCFYICALLGCATRESANAHHDTNGELCELNESYACMRMRANQSYVCVFGIKETK